MKISDFLSPADTLIDVRASDKAQLLHELSQRAGSSLGIPGDNIDAALSKREQLGSTGVGNGVAIPHARLGDIKRPYAILARLRKSIGFDAIDGQAVDIVFLLLLPAENAGEQLNVLASVARKLRHSSTLTELRKASGIDQLHAAIAG